MRKFDGSDFLFQFASAGLLELLTVRPRALPGNLSWIKMLVYFHFKDGSRNFKFPKQLAKAYYSMEM